MFFPQDLSKLDDSTVDAVQATVGKGLELRWYDGAGLADLAVRFLFLLAAVWIIVHLLYYRKTKRRDYFFTLILLSVSVFFLIYLLGSVKVKIGFALGLFAIFGILRYRTETIPVREMTYMFSVICLSVINALADTLSVAELLVPNISVILLIWGFEKFVLRADISSKLILYDRIELITPERREELIADLQQRTGLRILKVTVGSVDFLKDSAVLKIEYQNDGGGASHVNNELKVPRYEWENVEQSN